jgi:signal transduction histidine kinase
MTQEVGGRSARLGTLRLRVVVLAALVGVLTVISAIAFVVVASNTESVVTRGNQKRLSGVVAGLARAYAPPGDPTQGNDLAQLDERLSRSTTAVLRNEDGTEGGFYSSVGDQLVGYAFPTQGGPGIKRDIPPIERPLIEDVARHAAQDRQSTSYVFHGPRGDVILFAATPVLTRTAVGSAWVMKRLPGAQSGRSLRFSLGVAAFAGASLLCVLLAFSLARGVSLGVTQIEDRLQALDQDLSSVPTQAFTGLHELERIYRRVNELAMSLRDRTAREHDLQEKLKHKERLAALGQVAASVAHELRNPLTTIRLRAQMIGRSSDDPLVGRSTEMVLEEIARLDDMVERLLYFSRPLTLRFQRADMMALARTVVTSQEDVAQSVAVTLVGPDTGSFEIDCDPSAVRQVLDNIVRNAIEASSRGGTVTMACRSTDGLIVVSVRDQGAGMRETVRDNVFDPFFTTKSTGTGLGLSIAYEIAVAHHGRIDVESAPGEGTTVSVSLPIRSPSDDAPFQAATAHV